MWVWSEMSNLSMIWTLFLKVLNDFLTMCILELVTIHFTQSITAELAETKYLDNAFDAAVSSYFSQLMAQLIW